MNEPKPKNAAAQALRALQGPAATEARRAAVERRVEAQGGRLPCTCGRTESPHAALCPVGRRERRQTQRAKKAGTV